MKWENTIEMIYTHGQWNSFRLPPNQATKSKWQKRSQWCFFFCYPPIPFPNWNRKTMLSKMNFLSLTNAAENCQSSRFIVWLRKKKSFFFHFLSLLMESFHRFQHITLIASAELITVSYFCSFFSEGEVAFI